MNSVSGSHNYQQLTDKGLKLDQANFEIVHQAIKKGVDEAKNHLHPDDSSAPEIVYSDTVSVMGFSIEINSINVPISYLNLTRGNTSPIEFRDQLVCFVPDKFYMIVKCIEWLKLFGREETIHYYQYHGHPKLAVKFPQQFAESLSPKSLLLSDLEVETRKTVDEIATANDEPPVWKNIDEYFALNHPEHFNKSLDHLLTLPKPDIEISFEMENLLT